MAVPTPAIPSFTDGTLVHATSLNALASNLTNLFNENQGGLFTQRPCVIAVQTTGQAIFGSTDTLISFQTAPVNTNNMWVGSQASQITIQTAGIYFISGCVRYASQSITGNNANMGTANIWVNGTSPSNAVAAAMVPFCSPGGGGISPSVSYLANLAVGATIRLDAWQTWNGTATSQTTPISPYGSYLSAIFLTPST